jgi:hypothetical protein
MVPHCRKCVPNQMRAHMVRERCESCGRTLFFPQGYRQNLHVACSQRCRQAIHNAIAKAKRPDRNKTCIVCAKPFLAPRADALTCSSACRQKAYRQRYRLANGKAAP